MPVEIKSLNRALGDDISMNAISGGMGSDEYQKYLSSGRERKTLGDYLGNLTGERTNTPEMMEESTFGPMRERIVDLININKALSESQTDSGDVGSININITTQTNNPQQLAQLVANSVQTQLKTM